VAQAALKQANAADDFGLLDNNQALEGSVNAEREKENSDVKYGEAMWNPSDTSKDVAERVPDSARGREYDREVAKQITDSVTQECAFLRARLRLIMRSLVMIGTTRGVRKGQRLSNRYLVRTMGDIRAGEYPSRPKDTRTTRPDVRMAVAVVLDESGSMSSNRRESSRMLVSLTEPFDALLFPTLALGFRDGPRIQNEHSYYNPVPGGNSFHRNQAVCYDVFKTFDERFRAVQHRFANTVAKGGTPMADGIEYALRAIEVRPEPHRFIFVITDGQPNGGHHEVIKRQLRLAKAALIHVIGVALGTRAKYMKALFPDYVYSKFVSETPMLLLAKMNQLMDLRVTSGGMRPKN